MKRCVIISAGEIKNFKLVKKYLSSEDYYIFCDGGLAYANKLGIKPDLITGDFDSCKKSDLKKYSKNCETIQLPREKDDTDTLFAVKTALNKGFENFLLLGSMGARFDHAVANVSALLFLYEKNIHAEILDDFGFYEVAGKNPVFIQDSFSYFSVLTPFGNARKVNIKNAKYPLTDADLFSSFQSLGISNEVIPGQKAEVSCGEGYVLVSKIF